MSNLLTSRQAEELYVPPPNPPFPTVALSR